jgi:hypothetical protein
MLTRVLDLDRDRGRVSITHAGIHSLPDRSIPPRE